MRRILTFVLVLTHTFITAQGNWKKSFEECNVIGSTTIFDYKQQKWMTNDPEDALIMTLPASTFKIVNSLIALETGAVKDENEVIPWIDDYDTLRYGHRPNIYHSMSMKKAFALSAGWAYVEIAKRIGKHQYHEILTDIGYGNVDLSIQDADFWNFGSFGVSPVNQIETLVSIYEKTLPFSERSYNILKDLMVAESTDQYVIRAKTGWTRAGGKDTGWWVGYIETIDNTYFFATRLIKKRTDINPNFGNCRKEITKRIFKALGVL